MDAELIAEVPRYRGVHLKFAFEPANIAYIIDAFLEFSAKTRSYRSEPYPSSRKLVRDEIMLKRSRRRFGLVDGYFKIRVIFAAREELFIYSRGKVYRLTVNQHHPLKFSLAECKADSVAYVEASIKIFIKSLLIKTVRVFDLIIGEGADVVSYVLAAVKRYHRITAGQRVSDLIRRF
jgi:hypothetical protein